MAKINKVVFSILESLCYLDENLSKLLVVDIANEKLVEVLFNVKPLRGRRVDKRKLAISIHWPISSRREVVLGSNKFQEFSPYIGERISTPSMFSLCIAAGDRRKKISVTSKMLNMMLIPLHPMGYSSGKRKQILEGISSQV